MNYFHHHHQLFLVINQQPSTLNRTWNININLSVKMVATFYDGVILPLQGILGTLTHLLKQAEQHPNAEHLTNTRLHEDMYPVTDQVRLAIQFSENIVGKVTGREAVTLDPDLASYAKCYERIETVLKSLGEADRDVVNGQADVVSSASLGPGGTIDVTAAIYAHTLALPNVYFYLVTAYGILRKEGLPLKKWDYYNGFVPLIMGSAS